MTRILLGLFLSSMLGGFTVKAVDCYGSGSEYVYANVSGFELERIVNSKCEFKDGEFECDSVDMDVSVSWSCSGDEYGLSCSLFAN